jgi:murein DD-endopeptidase MepM/ murein hydrolase activator NlpD
MPRTRKPTRPALGAAALAAAVFLATAGKPGAGTRPRPSRSPAARLTPSPLARPTQRLTALAEQAHVATQAARAKALLVYRLGRGAPNELPWDASERLPEARRLSSLLLALRRDLEERRTLISEADRLQGALERNARAVAPTSGEPHPGPRLSLPVNGSVVGRAGDFREPLTQVRLRRAGVELLAKGGALVRAPGPGVVARVEPLPSGGHAVVMTHGEGWTTVVTGVRAPLVQAGRELRRGEPIGTLARTGDGAPVLTFEVWHGRVPVDPQRVARGSRD